MARSCMLLALAPLLLVVGADEAPAEAAAEVDCMNVEDPAGATAEGKAGDRECFGGDKVGQTCGWDGTPQEAYCELAANGLKVCARHKDGGKCNDEAKGRKGTPETTKTNDIEPGAKDGQENDEDEEGGEGSNLLEEDNEAGEADEEDNEADDDNEVDETDEEETDNVADEEGTSLLQEDNEADEEGNEADDDNEADDELEDDEAAAGEEDTAEVA